MNRNGLGIEKAEKLLSGSVNMYRSCVHGAIDGAVIGGSRGKREQRKAALGTTSKKHIRIYKSGRKKRRKNQLLYTANEFIQERTVA